jgi:hypothetical protein
MRRWLTGVVALAMCSVALAGPAGAAQWNFETLDGAGGANGRVNVSVGAFNAVILYGGQPHVWYADDINGDLRHGWWNGISWSFETLDGAGGANGRINASVGAHNAVMLSGGQPNVWYADTTNDDLRHAWWNGTTWSFETLDGAGGANGRVNADVGAFNAVMLSGDQPHVWYWDETGADLRHGWWNGINWSFETLDGAGGANGRVNANVGPFNAVTLSSGQPHVWYYNETSGDLRHGWWNGATWSFETLDGAGGASGRVNADVGAFDAVTLYGGQPHVWYYNETGGDMRHGWWNGAAWSFETLDGAGGANGRINANVGPFNAVTLYGGQPHVWYWDFSNGDLRHGWYG